MSADVKTFSLVFRLVIFTLTQECNFEVPRLNQNGWRCTDFRLDFLIDIVKKFVISLTSARSYSKASRCVKGFCHLRWKARVTSQTSHAAASRARQNRLLKYFLSFLGEPFTFFLSPSNQKIFRRGKGLKTSLYFNFIEKMGKYFLSPILVNYSNLFHIGLELK